MTAPLVMQHKVIPTNQKEKAEDDAKKVHVNVTAHNSTIGLNQNDILFNRNESKKIDSIQNKKQTMKSSVVETTKSFLSPRNPIKSYAAGKDLNPEEIQPTIMQKPSLERPGYHTQSSTNKIIDQSRNTEKMMRSSGGGGGGDDGDDGGGFKGSISEGMLMKAIFGLLGNMVKLREESTKTNQILVEQKSSKQKRLMDTYMEFKDRADSRKETAEIFGWTSFGAGLLAGIFAIGGIVATIATGGGALPILLGVGAGTGAVVSGGSEIASGVLHYQSELDAGKAFEVRKEKELIADETSRLMQDMESNDNNIVSVWSKASQILRNVPKFFR